jgi:hypothetical protein
MKTYIFRDIYTGRLYSVRDYTPFGAMRKLSQLANIPLFNLAHVKPQESLSHA